MDTSFDFFATLLASRQNMQHAQAKRYHCTCQGFQMMWRTANPSVPATRLQAEPMPKTFDIHTRASNNATSGDGCQDKCSSTNVMGNSRFPSVSMCISHCLSLELSCAQRLIHSVSAWFVSLSLFFFYLGFDAVWCLPLPRRNVVIPNQCFVSSNRINVMQPAD